MFSNLLMLCLRPRTLLQLDHVPWNYSRPTTRVAVISRGRDFRDSSTFALTFLASMLPRYTASHQMEMQTFRLTGGLKVQVGDVTAQCYLQISSPQCGAGPRYPIRGIIGEAAHVERLLVKMRSHCLKYRRHERLAVAKPPLPQP